MSPVVDFTGVEEKDFTPLPAGNYVVEVAGVEERETKKGEPMWNWSLRVVEGDYESRMVFTNTVLTKNSLWKLRQFLVALGYAPEDLSGELELDLEELQGLVAVARVTQRTYEGEIRNDVRSLKRLQAAEEEQEPAAEATDITAELAADADEIKF